jgi:hypothetical protein
LLRFSAIQPLARAIIVVSAVAVLATGVTFAALQSQSATLTGNTISTANADLRISTTGTTSTSSWAATKSGFDFTNVIPGTEATPADGNSFYLKNFGASAMVLKAAINTVPTNEANVDLSKVYLVFNRVDTSTTQKVSVAELVAANTTGGIQLTDTLAGGVIAQYKTQVVMDEDAFSGSSATIGGIDLVFNGTVIAQQ